MDSVEPEQRSWFAPRWRDLWLVLAVAAWLASELLQSARPDERTETLIIAGIRSWYWEYILAFSAVAAGSLWALTRCWLRPSARIFPTLIRLAVSLPLALALCGSTLFFALSVTFGAEPRQIDIPVEGHGTYRLEVDPGWHHGSAVLLRGGPFRYDIVAPPTNIECWQELTDETLKVLVEGTKATLTADLSDSCQQDQRSPFLIPFSLD